MSCNSVILFLWAVGGPVEIGKGRKPLVIPSTGGFPSWRRAIIFHQSFLFSNMHAIDLNHELRIHDVDVLRILAAMEKPLG